MKAGQYQINGEKKMAKNDTLEPFKNANIEMYFDDSSKKWNAELKLRNEETIEFSFNASENDLSDFWYGFNYNGKEYDMNICNGGDYGNGGWIYPVDNEGHVDTSISEQLDSVNIYSRNRNNIKFWTWKDYDDLSGHLVAPDGKSYFSYDWTTKEYKVTPDSGWNSFLDADPTRDTSLTAFKEYAQKFVKENIVRDSELKIIFEREYIDTEKLLEEEEKRIAKSETLADKYNRMEKLFEDKLSHLGSGDRETFKELCKWVEEEFPEKDSEGVLLEATSRMIEENLDFGEFNYQAFDDIYGFGDGAEWRFDLSDSAAKKLLSGEILTLSDAQSLIWEKAEKEFAALKENPLYKDEIEITDRINSAFRIADFLYPEFTKEIDKEKNLLADEWPQYSNEEKKTVINNAFEKIKSAFDEEKVRLSDSRTDELVFEGSDKRLLLGDFKALIKGKDAAEHGKESLSYIRPNKEQLHDGIENGWEFNEIMTGYAIFQNPDLDIKGGFTPKFISKLDDMNVFESDGDAAKQYGIDHNCRILEEKKDIWIGDENLEYYSYPDIPENRRIMKENGWLLEQPLEFDFSEFTEKDFNRIREELFKDNPKEDYYGRLHIGSLHVEFVINQNDGWVDTNYYILGEKGEGETQFGVPYGHFPGHQFASNLFIDNTYEEFKEKASTAVLDDIAEEGSLKPEAMRPLVDWNDEEQVKELYRTKLVEQSRLNEDVIAPYSREERDVEAVRDFLAGLEKLPASQIADEKVFALIDNIGKEQTHEPGDFLKIRKDGSVEHISALGPVEKEPVEVLQIINSFAEDHASVSEEGSQQRKDYEYINSLYEKTFENYVHAENISFIDDEEKMRDFVKISKEEFLSSYSYLSEEEYNATSKDYDKLKQKAVHGRFSDSIKTIDDVNNIYEKSLDFIEQNISFKESNPEYNEIDDIEKWKNGELYIPVADGNGNFTNDMEANTLADYNVYAGKNFESYSELIEYQAGLKAKVLDSAIENSITEYLRREYAETSPNSGKFELTVENQSYPIDKDGIEYITNKNGWGSIEDRLNEIIDKRFEEEIEQKENDILSDVKEYIAQESNGRLILKDTELRDVLFSDELVQVYAPKKEFLAIQPEEVKASLIESGIEKEELYNKYESMPISEEARYSMLSASYAGQGGLTLKAFADNGLEIDLATANALENCFSQIEAMTKYTADGHDLFHSGNGVDTISEHSIEYSETDKAWFVHEKNWLALSAVKGSNAGPEDYMEKADRVGDRNWAISCEELVKYVYQEIKEDGEMEKEFPDIFKKLEKLNEYLESLSEAKQLISDFCFEEYMSTPTFDDPKDVGLAYTTFEDPYTHEEYEVQTSVDLVNNKMTTKVNDKVAETSEYGSLKELIDDSLKSLDFDSLIYVPATKIDELLKEERENIEKNLLEKADQIVSETFDKPSLAKRAKLYVPSDYGYDPDNKIHILVEFDNNAEREDDLFNALAEKHLVLPNGREVDFNPIKPEKSGTIEQYFESLNRIKENRFQRRKEDYLSNIKVSIENFRDVFDEVIKLPKFKDKPLEAASWCFSRVPKESRPEVAQWFSNLGCKTKKDTDKLFSKWNKESNPKPNVIKSKNNDKDEWSISD